MKSITENLDLFIKGTRACSELDTIQCTLYAIAMDVYMQKVHSNKPKDVPIQDDQAAIFALIAMNKQILSQLIATAFQVEELKTQISTLVVRINQLKKTEKKEN